jgi:Flp pilus assembly protein TadD
MADLFLSSEEYDERAHKLYNGGDYDGALEMLKDGLALYPHSVELFVGLAYTRLARDEIAWAKHAFDRAMVLDPDHDEALVGLGEVLLRIGRVDEALGLYRRVRHDGAADDLELLLSMGRALYRERLYDEAQGIFTEATSLYPESSEAAAALGYTRHRMGDESAARRDIRRALTLDPAFHEARIYLGHLLYDRGNWRGALQEFERVPPTEYWDPLAIWRVLELKRALEGTEAGNEMIGAWELRLEELELDTETVDELLAEVESGALEPSQREVLARRGGGVRTVEQHRVRTSDGAVYAGTWLEIVRQLLGDYGAAGEALAEFMRRWADEAMSRDGTVVRRDDFESFIRGSARAGFLRIEC